VTRQRWAELASIGALVAYSVAVSACGCGKKAPDKQAAPAAAPRRAPAVLIGSVRLAPGHELPSYTPEQMERAVLAHVKGGTFPEICTPPKTADRTPVRQTPDGKLIGVMLAASEFSPRTAQPAAARAHEITIKDCRLTPTIVVARIGDSLHVKNEVNYPLLPGMGTDSFNQTLNQGQSRDIALDTGGVKLLMCGFTAPCGRTDIIVLAHPFAAVTDEKGEFRIDDFPADETLRLNAWHPLFSETSITTRVASGETKRVELVLTPAPPPPPPKPVSSGPKPLEPD
jgi:hypothetical protein